MAKFEDPFLDEDSMHLVDFRTSPEAYFEEMSRIADEENLTEGLVPAEIITNVPELAVHPAPVEQPVPDPVEQPEPELKQPVVKTFEDGSTMTLSKTNKGWEAVLNSGFGNPERFFGATKDELMERVLWGKVNATKQLRKLNRELKLETPVQKPAASQPAHQSKPMTADEIFEFKNQFSTNPDVALSEYFRRKTGMTIEQQAESASQGRQAKQEADLEAVAQSFLTSYPDYYPDDQNLVTIIKFLGRNKLGQTPRTTTKTEVDTAMRQLLDAGYWTVEDLGEAFTDLTNSELLKSKPRPQPQRQPERLATSVEVAPAAAPVPTPTVTSQAGIPPNPKLRAGLGIRAKEATSVVPQATEQRPPSVEELDSLSDKELAELLAASRRIYAQQKGLR